MKTKFLSMFVGTTVFAIGSPAIAAQSLIEAYPFLSKALEVVGFFYFFASVVALFAVFHFGSEALSSFSLSLWTDWKKMGRPIGIYLGSLLLSGGLMIIAFEKTSVFLAISLVLNLLALSMLLLLTMFCWFMSRNTKDDEIFEEQ
jgi:amino acid transporter